MRSLALNGRTAAVAAAAPSSSPRSIYELLDDLLAKESWEVEAGATAAVLGCAVALFLNIKKVLKRCSQLTRRETLFRLHQVCLTLTISLTLTLSSMARPTNHAHPLGLRSSSNLFAST